MRRGNQVQVFEAERKEFGLRLLGAETVGLVDHDPASLARSAHQFGDLPIALGQAVLRIDHQQHFVGLVDRDSRLPRHQFVERFALAGEPAGIDHDESLVAAFADAVLAIARQPGLVGDDRVAAAGENVEERGFADVGAADQRDDGDHRRVETDASKPNMSSDSTRSRHTSGCT